MSRGLKKLGELTFCRKSWGVLFNAYCKVWKVGSFLILVGKVYGKLPVQKLLAEILAKINMQN